MGIEGGEEASTTPSPPLPAETEAPLRIPQAPPLEGESDHTLDGGGSADYSCATASGGGLSLLLGTTNSCPECPPLYGGDACTKHMCLTGADADSLVFFDDASVCNQLGACVDDPVEGPLCVCEAGYRGAACEIKKCPPSTEGAIECNGLGVCTEGVCLCDPGFTGEACELASCPEDCNNNGQCDFTEGTPNCICDATHTGTTCGLECPVCSAFGFCSLSTDETTAICKCLEGYTGEDCGEKIETGGEDDGTTGEDDGSTGEDDGTTGEDDGGDDGVVDAAPESPFDYYLSGVFSSDTLCPTAMNLAVCQPEVDMETAKVEIFSLLVELADKDPADVVGETYHLEYDMTQQGWVFGVGFEDLTIIQDIYLVVEAKLYLQSRRQINDLLDSITLIEMFPPFTSCPELCSGPTNGRCLSSGECQCNPQYVGLDCSVLVCPPYEEGLPNCYLRGKCEQGNQEFVSGVDTPIYIEDNKCICGVNWTGADCSIGLCYLDCSGRGECNSQGEYPTCICETAYTGEGCEVSTVEEQDDEDNKLYGPLWWTALSMMIAAIGGCILLVILATVPTTALAFGLASDKMLTDRLIRSSQVERYMDNGQEDNDDDSD